MVSKRDRSLGGCGTCRTRHLKCDEVRPFCKLCASSGLVCSGYEFRLRFILEGARQQTSGHDGDKNFRRPLFTETERRAMSQQLVNDVFRTDPEPLIAKLDAESAESEVTSDVSIHHGPFGVFRFLEKPIESSPPPEDASAMPMIESSDDQDDVGATFNEQDFQGLLMDGTITDDLLDASTFNLDAAATLFALVTASGSPIASPEIEQTSSDEENSSALMCQFPQIVNDQYFMGTPTPALTNNQMPRDAWFLLTHYREHVINTLSPLKYNHKSPWHTLHYPTALNALAELNLGDSQSHARSALLSSVLAVSAFSLLQKSGDDLSGQFWKATGEMHKKEAHEQLKLCLRHETSGPKRSKYKEILTALLSMISVSVFGSSNASVLPYLLDAERFIRSKGLTKPHLSRKVRLLHHCYTYVRVLYESTTVLTTKALLGSSADRPSSPQKESLLSPRFLTRWDLEPDYGMSHEKDHRLGVEDLHHEVPGRWDSTLYPEIYGLPESIMALVSQVTRLGNERDLMLADPNRRGPSFAEFTARAKQLENHVCNWEPAQIPMNQQPGPYGDSPALESNRRFVASLQNAIHRALIIFFYRRVHDLNVKSLQHEVDQVRNHLSQCQAEDDICGDYTAAIVWPAFIAACEALSTDLQEFFSDWLTKQYRRSGLVSFESARQTVQSVWDARKMPNCEQASWPDAFKKANSLLVCTW